MDNNRYYDLSEILALREKLPVGWKALFDAASHLEAKSNKLSSRSTSDPAADLAAWLDSLSVFSGTIRRVADDYESATGRKLLRKINGFGKLNRQLDLARALYSDMSDMIRK